MSESVAGAAPEITVILASGGSGIGPPPGRESLPPNSEQCEWLVEPVAAGDVGGAWNRGVQRAAGAVLLFLRDDARPGPDLITAHRAVHQSHSRALALGALDQRAGSGDPRPADYCNQTISVRRSELGAAGGFPEGMDWGIEAELAVRLAAAGVRLVRIDRLVGTRAQPDGLRALMETRAAAGRGSVALYRRTPAVLPELELGSFGEGGPRAVLLRRVLLALGAPLWPVALVTALLPSKELQATWRRFLDSYLYWRGVWQVVTDRETRARLAHPPVILMYHAVGGRGERPGRYIVPVKRFRRQLAWLKWAKYRVLTIGEILEHRRVHRLPPARSIGITFDDGYQDNHRLALPLLRRMGMRATFFLVSQRIGSANRWDSQGELSGRPLMLWQEVRELARYGMEIGAHTRSHPVLPKLPVEARDAEIAGSRMDLERELGMPVAAFAYPYGRLDDATVRAAEAAGFVGACCSRFGPNDPAVSSHRLRRIEVRGTATLLQFAVALWGRTIACLGRKNGPR